MNLKIKFDPEGEDNGVLEEIAQLNNLPKKEGMVGARTDRWRWSNTSNIHKVGDYWPSTIADRIIEKYINKPFDEAFSYFCTKVPKYQQYKFLEEFEDRTRRWYPTYEIDEEGLIQKVEGTWNTRIKPVIYSEDYLCQYRHRETGHTIDIPTFHDLERGWGWYKWRGRKLDLTKYDLVTTRGWKKEFTSRNDPEFIRIHEERRKARAKSSRILEAQRKQVTYSFLTKEEKQKRELMKNNELVRDNHGFDETAFIDKIYHGQKKKMERIKLIPYCVGVNIIGLPIYVTHYLEIQTPVSSFYSPRIKNRKSTHCPYYRTQKK